MAKKTLTPQEILFLPMGENDADATTVGGYLIALLRAVWSEGESFSGKRPFGNSGWDRELFEPLVKAGLINGEITEWGVEDCNQDEGERLIASAIEALGEAAAQVSS